MELHQSPPYLEYIRLLHWQVEEVDSVFVFIKKLPFMGGMIKIQRTYPLPALNHLLPILKKYGIKQAVVEASEKDTNNHVQEWCKELKKHVHLIQSPYLPSKTIRINLQQTEDEIFHQFSEAKRRAVRRALKNNVVIREEASVQNLIAIKNKGAGFLGFITTHGVKEMWQAFGKDHATSVLAYVPVSLREASHRATKQSPKSTSSLTLSYRDKLLAGILLIFWDDIAYYWIAGATKQGKKLFAPTLLAWEAIKIAKHRGAMWFDWVGVWDERFPNDNKDWLGFTKFKEGFGGKTIYYPTHKTVVPTKTGIPG